MRGIAFYYPNYRSRTGLKPHEQRERTQTYDRNVVNAIAEYPDGFNQVWYDGSYFYIRPPTDHDQIVFWRHVGSMTQLAAAYQMNLRYEFILDLLTGTENFYCCKKHARKPELSQIEGAAWRYGSS